MNEMWEKLSRLTMKLQSQEQLPLWAIADEQLILDLALGNKPSWGPRKKTLYFLMKFAYMVKLSDLLIISVGICRIIAIVRAVKKNIITKDCATYERVFAGFGASSEEHLYLDYEGRAHDQPLRINWNTYKGVSDLGCPSFLRMISMLLHNSRGYTGRLKKSLPEIASFKNYFLTVCAVNIGSYSFYRCYWEMAKNSGIKEVCVLAPDVIAFAAVDSYINTIFVQHGLLGLCVVMPSFLRIETITKDEEHYFKASLGGVAVVRSHREIETDYSRREILLILSPDVLFSTRIYASKAIEQWAEKVGLTIVVRPTLAVTKHQLLDLKRIFPRGILDDLFSSLRKSIEHWRPKLIVGWDSTGLVTALEYNCLPVSLDEPDLQNQRWSFIYLMQKRVLFWPRDIETIESALRSTEVYQKLLDTLQLDYNVLISEQTESLFLSNRANKSQTDYF